LVPNPGFTSILVGADKGGVEKTTIARALADYLVRKNVPTRAFDTETPRGTLKRFHNDMTEVADIASTSDQMKILDTLNTGPPRDDIERCRRERDLLAVPADARLTQLAKASATAIKAAAA
jgi:cellulose biosynthesis protein BcsQ